MPDKNKIIFGTNNDTYIGADDAGNIVLQHEEGQRVALTSTSIEPATDETLDLGSANKKFKDLYLSSDSIYIGNTKLSSDPATGALSTVVADEQGQFTGSAAPVGGSGGAFDWEATGFTHFGPALVTPNTGDAAIDALWDKFNQMGTDTNFYDPIAIWNHTRGANPILDPELHINGSGPYGWVNKDGYMTFNPPGGRDQNFQLQHIGYLDKSVPTYGPSLWANSDMYFGSPDEFDAYSPTYLSPVMLFKDENNEYFKEFLNKAFLKHNAMSLNMKMEWEIVYTCSSATTAANTPFFTKGDGSETIDPDTDGIYRKTFTKLTAPDVVVLKYNRYKAPATADYNQGNGRKFPNDPTALENYHIIYFGSYNLQEVFPRNQAGVPEGWGHWSDGFNGTGYVSYDGTTYNHVSNVMYNNTTFFYSVPAVKPDGWPDPADAYRQCKGSVRVFNDFDNNPLSVAKVGFGDLGWTGDFFEGGICNHSDYPQSQTTTYENAGRGCEVKLRIKIR